MRADARSQPPPTVLAAFGAAGAPLLLAAGQGSSWAVGDLVLKPLDLAENELAWQADLLRSIRCDGFRVAPPRPALNGSLVVEGWCAWERLEGRHEERRWADVIAVGERFHAALAGIPRPAFIGRRTDPWAIGDRLAWVELPPRSDIPPALVLFPQKDRETLNRGSGHSQELFQRSREVCKSATAAP